MRTRFLTSAALVLLIAIGALAWASSSSEASPGLTVEDLSGPLAPTDLADALVGTGITISNVSYTGADAAAGT
ncbi:MAG: hypothetical protein AAB092_07965, partial [Chloroflexota bacterium]